MGGGGGGIKVGLWVINLSICGFFLIHNIIISKGPGLSVSDTPLKIMMNLGKQELIFLKSYKYTLFIYFQFNKYK